MSTIDKLASIGDGARLGENVTVGPFAVIEDGAVIGDGCEIGPHAYITRWARLGNDVRVFKGASVGTDPQDLKFEGEETTLEIGDRTVVREFATLNRGTHHSGKTVVGADCLLMAYSHVAHDCMLGNRVILANSVNMGGHVVIGDWAIIGGMVPIHQFVHIGEHALIGGGWRCPQDVPPFIIAAGEPIDYAGLNVVGLRRRGFTSTGVRAIKQAYKLLYRSGLNVSQGLERIRAEMELTPEVQRILEFVENDSDRGIVGRAKKDSAF